MLVGRVATVTKVVAVVAALEEAAAITRRDFSTLLPRVRDRIGASYVLHINSGCGKERRILIGPSQHSFGTTLRFTGPVPANSR